MGHLGIWLRFVISIPLIFLLGRLASNFVHGYMEIASILVYAFFLWIAGYCAYFTAPYKLGGLAFIYLYIWCGKSIFDSLIKENLTMLTEQTLNPFVYFGMVAVLCFIGLIGAYKEDIHYSTVEE